MECTDFIRPVAVLSCSESVKNAEHLFRESSFHNVLRPTRYCAVKGKGHIVLDFGKEYFGGIRIGFGNNTPGLKTPFLRIRFGESYMEACSELGEKGSTNDHSTRDMVVFMSGHSDMTWGSTGFRFVRIDFLEEAEYQIEYILLAFKHEEKPVLSFHSSCPELDAIMEAASRTLWLNKHDGVFFEGAKRDQHIWAGDLYPELTAAIYAFSSRENVKNSIDFLLKEDSSSVWYNDIPSYNAWLVLTLLRYFELTGDIDETYLDCIGDNMAMFQDLIDRDFVLDGIDPWGQNFFDWSTLGTKDSAQGIRCLFLYCLQRVSASPFVREEDKARALALQKKLEHAGDALSSSKAVNAVALLAKCPKAEERLDKIKEGGCRGYTAFLSNFILEALAEHGELRFAFETLLDYFGGMLAIGGTTLFEEFSRDEIEGACRLDECPNEGQKDYHGDFGEECYRGYRKSLCHAWSCGVIPFVLGRIVGAKIENGKLVSLTPNLLDLTFVDCVIATGEGPIHIHVKQDAGVYATRVENVSPKGETHEENLA